MFKRLLSIIIALSIAVCPIAVPAKTTAIFDNGTHVELLIHGSINNAQDEINFRHITAGEIESVKIIINSPGGDVPEMFGIIQHIEDLKANGVHVTTEVTGRALSAGVFLWLMGDERITHKTSKLMFHKASYTNAYGTVDCKTLFPAACWQLEFDNQWGHDLIRSIVSEKITNFLFNDNDVWINGQGAFDLGLATEIK